MQLWIAYEKHHTDTDRKLSIMKKAVIKRVLLTVSTILILTGCGIFKKQATTPHYVSSFTDSEIQLIMQRDSSKPMRVLQTNITKDSLLLREVSSDIKPDSNDPFLAALISRMLRTVKDSASLGVGIAAPQVGILKRVILVQRFDKENDPFEVYLNPKIVKYSGMKQECREGCLSVPGVRGITKSRAYAIMIEYFKPDNTFVTEMVEGFTAVIFQHEIDHLNGLLFYDYL